MTELTGDGVSEPWPLWRVTPPSRDGSTEDFDVTPAIALKLPLVLAGLSVLVSFVSLILGYWLVPVLLALIHLPALARAVSREQALFRNATGSFVTIADPDDSELEDLETRQAEQKARFALEVECRKNAPTFANGYKASLPLLFGDDGMESLLGAKFDWTDYTRFEIVERQENALIVRMAESREAVMGYWEESFSMLSFGGWKAAGASFRDRFEAAVPMLGALWVFVVNLLEYGWRVDTVAALGVWLTHVLFSVGLSRLWRQVAQHDFDRNPIYTYLAFDTRVTTEAEALNRLAQYLPNSDGWT